MFGNNSQTTRATIHRIGLYIIWKFGHKSTLVAKDSFFLTMDKNTAYFLLDKTVLLPCQFRCVKFVHKIINNQLIYSLLGTKQPVKMHVNNTA